jgi:hypothetical protein
MTIPIVQRGDRGERVRYFDKVQFTTGKETFDNNNLPDDNKDRCFYLGEVFLYENR